SYYEDIDLAFRLRWAGYRCLYNPACVVHHDISATNDHRSATLQRRISRNAELVFWWNLPARSLLLAAIPHCAFVAAQAAWRLARGRLRPFLAGKVDAARLGREILDRRRLRTALSHAAIARPHFTLTAGTLVDVRHHLRRPRETTRAMTGPRYRYQEGGREGL